MMQPYSYREKKFTICPSCLEVNTLSIEVCSSCNISLEFRNENSLLEINEAIMFYAYQQRITLEKEIENSNGKRPLRHYSHIPYSEILTFLSLTVLSGITWDGIKYLVKKIHTSIQNRNIIIDDDRMIKSGVFPDKELLENLATDNSKLEKFVAYLEDYKNGMPDVHPHIKEETRFIQLPDSLINDGLIKQIIITAEKEVLNLKKSK